MAGELESMARITSVTPDDGNDLTKPTNSPYDTPRGILVESADSSSVIVDLAIVDAYGNALTLRLATGIWHPIRPKRIKSTGTTASAVRAGW